MWIVAIIQLVWLHLKTLRIKNQQYLSLNKSQKLMRLKPFLKLEAEINVT